MKINNLLNEGIFSDIANINFSDRGQPSTAERKKEREKILNKVRPAYLKDFIEDFLVDFKKAIERGTIDVNLKTAAPKVKPELTKPNIQSYQPTTDITGNVPTYNTPTGNPLKEDDYHYLNSLLEATISEQNNQPVSIADWVVTWFKSYMRGIDIQQNTNSIVNIAKKMEAEKGNFSTIKDDLNQLANISWEAVKKSDTGEMPYGAQNVPIHVLGSEKTLTPDEILQAELKLSSQQRTELDQKRKLMKNNP